MRQVSDYELLTAMAGAMYDPVRAVHNVMKQRETIQQEALQRRFEVNRMKAEARHAQQMAEYHRRVHEQATSAVRAVRSDMRPVLIEALTHGWTASITGSGHVKLTHPVHGIVFTSCTTGDVRTVRNLRRQLRRAESGFVPPHHHKKVISS